MELKYRLLDFLTDMILFPSITVLSALLRSTRAGRILTLSDMNITAAPNVFDDSVEEFRVEGYKVKEIPKEIGALSNLKTVEIVCSRVKTIPDTLGNATNLNRITARYSRLTALPDKLQELNNLTEINIFKNDGIKEFPKILCTLSSSLKTFVFSHCRLSLLPEAVWDKMGKLIHLDLSGNRFRSLPVGLNKLENLHCLQLSENPLGEISQEITELKNLKQLFLSNCRSKGMWRSGDPLKIPESVKDMVELEELDLSNNGLLSVPDSIGGKLTKLIKLDLSNNRLSVLPLSIVRMLRDNKEMKVNLTGNPLNVKGSGNESFGIKQLKEEFGHRVTYL